MGHPRLPIGVLFYFSVLVNFVLIKSNELNGPRAQGVRQPPRWEQREPEQLELLPAGPPAWGTRAQVSGWSLVQMVHSVLAQRACENTIIWTSRIYRFSPIPPPKCHGGSGTVGGQSSRVSGRHQSRDVGERRTKWADWDSLPCGAGLAGVMKGHQFTSSSPGSPRSLDQGQQHNQVHCLLCA